MLLASFTRRSESPVWEPRCSGGGRRRADRLRTPSFGYPFFFWRGGEGKGGTYNKNSGKGNISIMILFKHPAFLWRILTGKMGIFHGDVLVYQRVFGLS